MESWEFRFQTDPITKKNQLEFGNELVAEAGARPPLDWLVRFKVIQPRASTLVVGAGLAAMAQRERFARDRMGAFDIGSALAEVIAAETAQDIVATGAQLQLAWLKLEAELERLKFRP